MQVTNGGCQSERAADKVIGRGKMVICWLLGWKKRRDEVGTFGIC